MHRLCSLSVSPTACLGCRGRQDMAAFYPLTAVVYTVQSDYRPSEAPHLTPNPEVLFSGLWPQNYPWAYRGDPVSNLLARSLPGIGI